MLEFCEELEPELIPPDVLDIRKTLIEQRAVDGSVDHFFLSHGLLPVLPFPSDPEPSREVRGWGIGGVVGVGGSSRKARGWSRR